jgi:large conductance mechanosensitive channel
MAKQNPARLFNYLVGNVRETGPREGSDRKKGMGTMLQEFKSFIAKGNVMDMAVGIIIGAAFTAIVKSMVDDLINPIIGFIFGGADFTNYFWVLGDGEFASLEAAREAGAGAFAYGAFFTAVINFLIIAFVVFMLVRYVNKVKALAEKPEEPKAEEPKGPTEVELLQEIRDALATQK